MDLRWFPNSPTCTWHNCATWSAIPNWTKASRKPKRRNYTRFLLKVMKKYFFNFTIHTKKGRIKKCKFLLENWKKVIKFEIWGDRRERHGAVLRTFLRRSGHRSWSGKNWRVSARNLLAGNFWAEITVTHCFKNERLVIVLVVRIQRWKERASMQMGVFPFLLRNWRREG